MDGVKNDAEDACTGASELVCRPAKGKGTRNCPLPRTEKSLDVDWLIVLLSGWCVFCSRLPVYAVLNPLEINFILLRTRVVRSIDQSWVRGENGPERK